MVSKAEEKNKMNAVRLTQVSMGALTCAFWIEVAQAHWIHAVVCLGLMVVGMCVGSRFLEAFPDTSRR